MNFSEQSLRGGDVVGEGLSRGVFLPLCYGLARRSASALRISFPVRHLRQTKQGIGSWSWVPCQHIPEPSGGSLADFTVRSAWPALRAKTNW